MQTEKSQPSGQRIMPETPALSIYPRVGISLSASETDDRFYLSPMRMFAERFKQQFENLTNSLPALNRKLRWFDHISMSSGSAKTILQGTVKGKRNGRQKKRWGDNKVDRMD